MNRRDFLKTLGVGAITVQLPGVFKKSEQAGKLNNHKNKRSLSVYCKDSAIRIGGADSFNITTRLSLYSTNVIDLKSFEKTEWIIESKNFYPFQREKIFVTLPVTVIISLHNQILTGNGVIHSIATDLTKIVPMEIKIYSTDYFLIKPLKSS